MNNSRAHNCLSVFNSICDDYNNGKLNNLDEILSDGGKGSVSYLRVLQSMTLEAYDLFRFLYSKEQTEATRAYLIFCGKIMLRLSYLINEGRRETDKETVEYFKDFNAKNFHGGI